MGRQLEKERHISRRWLTESPETTHMDKPHRDQPFRDALLLTMVRWTNRNQDPKFQKQRGRAAVVAGTVLFLGVTAGPKVYETAEQVRGKRCMVGQVGYRVQPGDSVNRLINQRHPGYNPIERTVATICIMERNRSIKDPTTLKVDSFITIIKVK